MPAPDLTPMLPIALHVAAIVATPVVLPPARLVAAPEIYLLNATLLV